MLVSDILNKSNVLVLDGELSKRQVLQLLAEHAAKTTQIDERILFEALLERENLGSTAFGKGIAFPHARVPNLEKLQTIFAKVPSGVDFESADGQNVDLLFMLISPETSGADHLTALALMSAAMKDEQKLSAIRATKDVVKIYDILTK
jgi:PTS system nitrogen regulatory IIA component